MFTPQRYMSLTVGKDKIHLNKMIFGLVEDSYETFTNNHNIIGLLAFIEKYKGIGILVENSKSCIEIFQELIDDGEPIPGYVMMFDDNIFFLLTNRSIPQGIKRIGDEKEENKSNGEIIKLPDIRKLLERV